MQLYSLFHAQLKNQAHIVEPHDPVTQQYKAVRVLGENTYSGAPPFQLATPPGLQVNIPKGNLVFHVILLILTRSAPQE